MSILDRGAILANRSKFRFKDVVIDDWGNDTIRLRELTSSEKDQFEIMMSQAEAKPPKHIRAWLIRASVVDSNGRQAFTEQDLDAVGGIPSTIGDILIKEIRVLNRMNIGDSKEDIKSDAGQPATTVQA